MHPRKRLQPKVDVPASRWHHIRDRFRCLFLPEHFTTIERWYNTVATSDGREAFRRAMKSLFDDVKAEEESGSGGTLTVASVGGEQQQSGGGGANKKLSSSGAALPQLKSQDDRLVAEHAARQFALLYGAVLSPQGHERVAHWVVRAPSAAVEDFRRTITAIQCTFTTVSATKAAFVAKAPDDDPSLQDRTFFRKKIDWMSKKVHRHMQETTVNPMAGRQREQSAASAEPEKRFTKPKGQFDGGAVLQSLGLDGPDAIDKLRERREAAAHALVTSVEPSGCVVYCRPAKGENKVNHSSRTRIVAPFQATNASSWISTTRDTLKDHSGSALSHQYISAEEHPSVSLQTASLGMVVPSLGQPSLVHKQTRRGI